MSLLFQKNGFTFFDNTTPDFLLIRLSGNHIDAKRFYQTITGVIVQGKGEMTKIH